jgi:hypothetical protein
MFKGGKAKVSALIAAGMLTAVQAQAALLQDTDKIDMTEFLAVGGVIAGSYLVIKGVQKALQLLRGA